MMKTSNYPKPRKSWRISTLQLCSALVAAVGFSQELEIEPAMQLQFDTSIGTFHVLESSKDMQTWSPLFTRVGDGFLKVHYVHLYILDKEIEWSVEPAPK